MVNEIRLTCETVLNNFFCHYLYFVSWEFRIVHGKNRHLNISNTNPALPQFSINKSGNL